MGQSLSDYLTIVAQPEEQWNLFEISLEISRILRPRLDLQACRELVARMAQRTRGRLGGESGTYDVINALNITLFEEFAFEGNRQDYYNPKNSYMCAVLEERKGIPITLCILYQEVAARLGLELLPVAMPGHFLLKYVMPQRQLYVDAFNRGEILLEAGCEERLREVYPSGVEFTPDFLKTASPREVVLRMLMNLKMIYRDQSNRPLLVEILERRIPLLRDPVPEILERGFLYLNLENYRGALADLEFFVQHSVDPEIKELVNKRLEAVRRLARGN